MHQIVGVFLMKNDCKLQTQWTVTVNGAHHRLECAARIVDIFHHENVLIFYFFLNDWELGN